MENQNEDINDEEINMMISNINFNQRYYNFLPNMNNSSLLDESSRNMYRNYNTFRTSNSLLRNPSNTELDTTIYNLLINILNDSYEDALLDIATETSNVNTVLERSMEDEFLIKDEDVDTSNIPMRILTAEEVEGEKKEDLDKCFCTVDFKKFDVVSNLACNHIFHYDCITEWCKYNNVCPACRNEIEL